MMVILFTVAFSAQQSGYIEEFERANSYYAQNEFEKAAECYERLISEGVNSPKIYFNLGNTYYRLGKKGLAIANYEKALLLEPSFKAATKNLEKVVGQTKHKLPRPQDSGWKNYLFVFGHHLKRETVYAIALFFWVMLWLSLAAYIVTLRRWVLSASAIILILSFVSGLWAWEKAHPTSIAVASQEEVPVRYGASEQDPVRFILYEGDRVKVDQVRDRWIRVETTDGERGWADSSGFTMVSTLGEQTVLQRS